MTPVKKYGKRVCGKIDKKTKVGNIFSFGLLELLKVYGKWYCISRFVDYILLSDPKFKCRGYMNNNPLKSWNFRGCP